MLEAHDLLDRHVLVMCRGDGCVALDSAWLCRNDVLPELANEPSLLDHSEV